MDDTRTPNAPVASRASDAARSLDTRTSARDELRRRINDILTRSQALVGVQGDQPVSQADLIGTVRTIRQLAEQALDALDNRLPATSTLPSSPHYFRQPTETAAPLLPNRKPELLVVDDNAVNRELLARRLELQGYRISRADNGRTALDQLQSHSFDLVLLDIMMPEIDGYEVLKTMKGDEALRHIPVIMISALGDLDSIVRCIEVGAEDYLPKPFNSTLLVARVEASLEKKHLRDQERLTYQALVRSQNQLAGELAEAAAYVRSLLPAPLNTGIRADWLFIPSTQLGGDSFGYYWLDDDHFVMFLLDVCGHGVGAALLSISVINVLRSRSLVGTDFLNPAQVLQALNETFPMEKQNNMYFTMWYGVFNKKSRELTYAVGGHPHTALVTGPTAALAKPVPMGAAGLLIGGMPGITYRNHTHRLDAYAKLILYSDGVCEIADAQGNQWDYDDFYRLLTTPPEREEIELQRVLDAATALNGGPAFHDDFSIVKFLF